MKQENNGQMSFDQNSNLNGLIYNPGHSGGTYYDYNHWQVQPYKTITTTNYRQQLIGLPEAHITVKKSRLKKYDNFKYYMADNTEFEIELFNSTTEKLGVKIKINGKYISNAHLVINPGQRIFLERHIDTNNKFLFKTYEVESNSQEWIKNNGNVEVEFYREYYQQSYTAGGGQLNWMYYCTTPIGNNLTSNIALDNIDSNLESNINDVKSAFSGKLTETGIIDKGEKTNQNFNNSYETFEALVNTSKEFKILPLSQKPVETKDLIPKCGKCFTKGKKDDNYCSKCGTKL